ncbi:phosphoglucomutase/phosphomannomutase family protein [Candidatus Omnitrophota bacterium]
MHSKKAHIRFGTDGWRGIISDNFTFENVQIVAQAISDWIHKYEARGKERKIVAVGYDTRFQSDAFAQLVARVLAANKIKVILSDRAITTPMLSFTVKHRRLTAGVMITASHNPASFNGIKIKTASGGGAPKSLTDKVEKLLFKSSVKDISLERALEGGSICFDSFITDYISFLRSYIDLSKIRTIKSRILVNPMYGSGNGYIGDILKGTSVKLEFMNNDVNPSFGGLRPEPVVENLADILLRMKKEKFSIGLVLDGDGDRIAAVAAGGVFLHPQQILSLLTLHLAQHRGWKGGVVKTICGSAQIDKVAKYLGLPLYETPVGFKYISDIMTSEDILIGGEEAGGIGYKGYIPERDGILSALLLLELMAYRRRGIRQILHEMEHTFGRYYYLRSDLKLKGTKPPDVLRLRSLKKIAGRKVVQVKDFDGLKLVADDESWLMFRASGTEPLVRIYVEAKSLKRAQQLITYGEATLKRI